MHIDLAAASILLVERNEIKTQKNTGGTGRRISANLP
jgi:hypothetical protein